MGSRATRPMSAGTRRRLATPVAIPRAKPAASAAHDGRPPFGHYANTPRQQRSGYKCVLRVRSVAGGVVAGLEG